jgi:hypothetical protein
MSLGVSASILPDRPEFLHREMPWITLSSSAEVPRGGAVLRKCERQRLLQDILECERCLAAAESFVHRRGSSEGVVDPQEVRNGWRKFFLAHYAFFHTFALLADLYRQCAAALAQGSWPLHQIEQVCSLWRLAGALMLYGVDFSPTETIYQQYIRPRMPEAFSGTWLREYALLSESRRHFDRALDDKAVVHRELVRDLRSSLSESEKCYHQFHFQVMLACVPDLTSKLQEYQLEHGKLVQSEQHFEIYDEWFHVLRLPDVDLSCYVRSVCALFSELLADLVDGTFLEPDPLAKLTAGVSTVLEILRTAVGEETIQ